MNSFRVAAAARGLFNTTRRERELAAEMESIPAPRRDNVRAGCRPARRAGRRCSARRIEATKERYRDRRLPLLDTLRQDLL